MAEQVTHTPGPWHAETAPCGTRVGLMGAGMYPVAMLGMKAALNPADVVLIETAPELLAELEETAAWLEERAEVLGAIVNPMDRGGDAAKAVRAEIARYRGRAALLRQLVAKAKGGAS